MATKMTPHIYVHKKLGFGRPANDPEVQSIVNDMHDDFDAAAKALKDLKAISDNIPEMVLFDQRGKGLNAKSGQAATFDIFSDDKKVAKAANKKYQILWKNRTTGKATRTEFNQLITNLANNPFFSGGDHHIFEGDMTKLLEHLKPLPDSDTFESHKFPTEVLDSWWDVKYPQGRPTIRVRAPDSVKVETPTAVGNNKTEATLKFEAEVLRLMTCFWNARNPNTTPTKGDLCKLVYKEMLPGKIRGARDLTEGMVRDAAKPWKKPIVLPAYVPPASFGEKRHPFKDSK